MSQQEQEQEQEQGEQPVQHEPQGQAEQSEQQQQQQQQADLVKKLPSFPSPKVDDDNMAAVEEGKDDGNNDDVDVVVKITDNENNGIGTNKASESPTTTAVANGDEVIDTTSSSVAAGEDTNTTTAENMAITEETEEVIIKRGENLMGIETEDDIAKDYEDDTERGPPNKSIKVEMDDDVSAHRLCHNDDDDDDDHHHHNNHDKQRVNHDDDDPMPEIISTTTPDRTAVQTKSTPASMQPIVTTNPADKNHHVLSDELERSKEEVENATHEHDDETEERKENHESEDLIVIKQDVVITATDEANQHPTNDHNTNVNKKVKVVTIVEPHQQQSLESVSTKTKNDGDDDVTMMDADENIDVKNETGNSDLNKDEEEDKEQNQQHPHHPPAFEEKVDSNNASESEIVTNNDKSSSSISPAPTTESSTTTTSSSAPTETVMKPNEITILQGTHATTATTESVAALRGIAATTAVTSSIVHPHSNAAYHQLRYMIVSNDGTSSSMIKLVGLKSLFAKQLPKMPRPYISRLVFDKRHTSLAILSDHDEVKDSDDEIIGGICYRAFPDMRFAEIAFCAVHANHQVKGYGTKLMNLFKQIAARQGIEYFITYADNYAIGYFKKQGFTKSITMPKGRYFGLIKDYDGGTPMECYIHPSIDYTRIHEMIEAQKQYILSRVALFAQSNKSVYEPLPSDYTATQLLDGVSRANLSSAKALTVPGVMEAGWTMNDLTSSYYYNSSTTTMGGGGGGSSGMGVSSGSNSGGAGGNANITGGKGGPNVNNIGGNTSASNDGAGNNSSLLLSSSKELDRQKNQLKNELLHIIRKIEEQQFAWPFREPVDVDEVTDYLTVIQEPIDLSTIEKRIKSSSADGNYYYKSKQMLYADLMLMVNNCKLYNDDASTYMQCAINLEKFLPTVFDM